MGKFKKITASTELTPRVKIREFNKNKDDCDNYVIGNHKIDSDTYEVYPDGVDYLNKEGVDYQDLFLTLIRILSTQKESTI